MQPTTREASREAVSPLWIDRVDQLNFPFSGPSFDFLRALTCSAWIREDFVIDQSFWIMAAGRFFRPVPEYRQMKIMDVPRVKCSSIACKDINIILFRFAASSRSYRCHRFIVEFVPLQSIP